MLLHGVFRQKMWNIGWIVDAFVTASISAGEDELLDAGFDGSVNEPVALGYLFATHGGSNTEYTVNGLGGRTKYRGAVVEIALEDLDLG